VPGRPSRRRAPAAGPGESQPRARRDDAGVKKELAETNNGRGNLRAQHCLFRRDNHPTKHLLLTVYERNTACFVGVLCLNPPADQT
jgi:hypothetical protein